MTELLERSARFVDDRTDDGPASTNPVDRSLHQLTDRVAMVASFSHVVALDAGDRLVVFDTSTERAGPPCVAALRTWSQAPVDTVVFTHGHFDHVGGAAAVLADADGRGEQRPRVVAHENVPARFERYERTNRWNALVNLRQFRGARGVGDGDVGRFGPEAWVHPDTTFPDRCALRVGDLHIELHHARGETDDHAWAWIPELSAVCTGDFVTWVFPNAGNPQKVQRYPAEWARALRDMAALGPALLLPAHGLPIAGRERIAGVLDDIATALEHLVDSTVALMNAGATLDEIVHTVEVPADLLDRPYLRPVYDEPEFVVRNIWRLYGGWWDGRPDRLKPAPDAAVAAQLADLAGGAGRLAERARELSERGELRLACHLAELAGLAAPDDAGIAAERAAVYRRRAETERSLMARGIFGEAGRES